MTSVRLSRYQEAKLTYRYKFLLMTSVFLSRYREAHVFPIYRAHRKGQDPYRITSQITLGSSTNARKWISKTASLERLPVISIIELRVKMLRTSFSLVYSGAHTITAAGVVSQDYRLLLCATLVHANTK